MAYALRAEWVAIGLWSDEMKALGRALTAREASTKVLAYIFGNRRPKRARVCARLGTAPSEDICDSQPQLQGAALRRPHADLFRLLQVET